MERQDYALRHKSRYVEWCENVQSGPYSPLDKLEFSLLSAHCPMESAILGWQESRKHYTLDALKSALVRAGVFAPIVKAERIHKLRRDFRRGELDIPTDAPFREWRDTARIEGLGYCKKSFAACLIAPLEADVACLDTHICQIYNVNPSWVYRKAENYAAIENILRLEAEDAGLPIFAYQWAIWDWKRSLPQWNGKPQRGVWGNKVEDHSFLWEGGRTQYQSTFKFAI